GPVIASPCGPGPGWISTCTPGVNTLDTTTVVDVIINTPVGPMHIPHLSLSGPTSAQIGMPAVDADGLAFLNVSFSRHLSSVLPNGLPLTVDTTGTAKIFEQTPGSGTANSFFDIFVDLTLSGQHLQSPLLHGTADRNIIELPLGRPQSPVLIP